MIGLLLAAQLAGAPAQAAPVPPAAPTVRVQGQRLRTSGDPYEHFNRHMYRLHERFDRKFQRPAAMAYKHAVPKFLRSALRHFFSNLGEPVVFLNYVLQLKPGKAAETVARFAINSTIGLGGTVDLAKRAPVSLPHRPNGLGDTLGFYGVKSGPYLFLPFVGPTTVRDLIGGQADGLVLPLAVGKPFDKIYYQVPRAVITGLDLRAENDDELKALLGDAVDPYATLRSVYLQDRAGEIAQLHGAAVAAPAVPELGEPLADPGNATAPSSAAPELNDPLADPAGASSANGAAKGNQAPTSNAPELQDTLADPAARAAPPGGTQPAPPAANAPELADPLADPAAAAPAAPARR